MVITMKYIAIFASCILLIFTLGGCSLISATAKVAGTAVGAAATVTGAAAKTVGKAGKAAFSDSERTKTIKQAAKLHKKAARRVRIGWSRERTLQELSPSQIGLPPDETRAPRYFQNDEGRSVEIHYMRSARGRGRPAGDEAFTPYMFVDGVLVATGWAEVGDLDDDK